MIPLGLWMVRNYKLTGMFVGHMQTHSIDSFRQNLAVAVNTVTAWLVPSVIPSAVRVAIVGSLAVLILWVLVALPVTTERRRGIRHACVLPASVVMLVYIPLVLYIHQVGASGEPLNDRHLVPLAVILLWLLFIGIDDLVAMLRSYSHHGLLAASAMLVFWALWIVYPLECTCATIRERVRHGAGGYSETM